MSRREQTYDQMLVLQSQEGDEAAFGELVGRWQERLWRHAWRLTGNEEAAWDAVQEGWMAVNRGLRGLQDPAAFPGWIYRIVSNKCRDWIRKEQRRRKAVEIHSESAARAQDEAADARERTSDLREALARLPGDDRAILAMRYNDGFSTAEIGEILGIPAGTVKSRLFHARKRLQSMMEEMNDE